ncbi:MAG: Type 1 glutamine amidotransferase-like domain-containing protein [Anaerolineae bacterium]|nr:Type 1 glutamine amidotransferase-like domain-containing protein [Anaerolineae bacterium]
MTQAGPLQWRTGAGWLILAGGGRWQAGETGAVDAAALGWADLDCPIAVLLTAGGSSADGEALLEYYGEMGGPSGYILPIHTRADAQRTENYQLLAEAGLVYISDGPDPLGLVQTLHESPALAGLERAFDNGAAIVGMGSGAVALGAWAVGQEATGPGVAGWGWLPDVIVEPHFTGTESSDRLRSLLSAHPSYLGLGIPDGTALALGPNGRVETLGEGQVTVVLGKIDQK